MDYAARRASFSRSIGEAVAVIPGAAERLRNGDSEYPFRQDSDFLYLTGFNEPDAVLVLVPTAARDRSIIFLRDRDPAKEVWNGARVGVERAPGTLGVDAAYSIERIDEILPDCLVGSPRLYYALGKDSAFDRRMLAALDAAQDRGGRLRAFPQELVDPGTVLHEMRLRKDADEVAVMRRAAQITAQGHVEGMRVTAPGMHEFELQAHIEFAYRRAGAQDVAYTSIVAGGVNATTLHYNTNRMRLDEGGLVLVDSGCELDGYASDVTRTWPITGRFTAEQRAVYEVVLRAQRAGIDRVKPGNGCRDFHEACVRVITEGLIDLGLLSGSLDENIETNAYRAYYMHGSGHWLGLDVHDAGRYRDDSGHYRAFEPGMVTTVEPGIYIGRDAAVPDGFQSIGIRIEDDIYVTAHGNENFTADIPKTVEEIEAIAGAGACV